VFGGLCLVCGRVCAVLTHLVNRIRICIVDSVDVSLKGNQVVSIELSQTFYPRSTPSSDLPDL